MASSSSGPPPFASLSQELALDLRRATRHYVDTVVSGIEGMKVLLMDTETIGMVSMTYTQSELLEKEVFLFQLLDSKRETLMHLKAIVFVRPTAENSALLQNELRSPKYSEYYLFFSNIIPNALLGDLARADTLEVVKQVKELYVDYFTINRDLFTLDIPTVIGLEAAQRDRALTRISEGISAVLLSLKKRPLIRYQRNSDMASRVAHQLSSIITNNRVLFDVGPRSAGSLLLILDRRTDPITPLLTQWTYQAMVHECLGITKNRCRLHPPDAKPSSAASSSSSSSSSSSAPAAGEEPKDEVVLSSENDDFFRQNMFLNWGEVCQNIKSLMDRVKLVDPSKSNIESIEDMKRILENFPQFKQMKGIVSKHVAILEELAGIVKTRTLLEVSSLEQELACMSDHATALRKVKAFLDNPNTRELDRLKVTMLYALRYEREPANETNQLLTKLETLGVHRAGISLIPALLRFAGASERPSDLWGEKTSWMERLGERIVTPFKGVENMYTLHKPHLNSLLADVFAGKPFVDAEFPAMSDSATVKQRPTQIIVFIVGGATYEEAALIAKMNVENPATCIVLGGTTIHNSETFLEDIHGVRT